MPHLHLQRGAATLGITLLLLAALGIAAAATQRRHAGELRAEAARLRAVQAIAAAEAGLAWATAMLNAPATGFRERHLSIAPDSGVVTPSARRAACERVDDTWRCRRDDEAPAAGNDGTAAFEIGFEPAVAPGTVRLVALGCLRLPCGDGDGPGEAAARVEVTLGLVPALAHPPLAPLTARDDVDAGAAALALYNADASTGGIAIHAGGAVRADNARLVGPPGAPVAQVVAHDAALRDADPEHAFLAAFGLDAALWRQQPTVAAIACTGRCNDSLTEALATHRLVHVSGDLLLEGPLDVGSPDRPVLVVAAGTVRLRGAVMFHGLLRGDGVVWDAAPQGGGVASDAASQGGLVRGALVSAGGYTGTGAPALVHDRALLAALKTAGSFAPLPGSWKDFR
jgi:hypothetical protein